MQTCTPAHDLIRGLPRRKKRYSGIDCIRALHSCLCSDFLDFYLSSICTAVQTLACLRTAVYFCRSLISTCAATFSPFQPLMLQRCNKVEESLYFNSFCFCHVRRALRKLSSRSSSGPLRTRRQLQVGTRRNVYNVTRSIAVLKHSINRHRPPSAFRSSFLLARNVAMFI